MKYKATTITEILVVMIIASVLLAFIINGLYLISKHQTNIKPHAREIHTNRRYILDTIFISRQNKAIVNQINAEQMYE